MHEIHVITYPSVWLPEPPCHRVLVLGGDAAHMSHVCDQIHTWGGDWSWALYHVQSPNILDVSLTDWILTQHAHVHAVWCHVHDPHVFTWAALWAPHMHVIHCDPVYRKLLHWHNIPHEDLSEVIKNQAQRCTS